MELQKNACEEDLKICWKEAKVLQIEPNITYKKCKEAAHMVLADRPTSQPNLVISPIWTPTNSRIQ
jgi:hypothetical protein